MNNKETELDIKFRESIVKAMREKDLSYTDMQKLTGIERSTIHKWATGERRVPINRAFLIADVLGLTVEEMVGR